MIDESTMDESRILATQSSLHQNTSGTLIIAEGEEMDIDRLSQQSGADSMAANLSCAELSDNEHAKAN